jgi:hypothetical protein
MPFAIALIVILSIALLLMRRRWRRSLRIDYIRSCALPPEIYARLQKRHPQLSLKDCQLVGHALRQFYLAYLRSGCRYVSMPSQVVDDLWHEWILYTRHYQQFCRRAFGRFLHHTPAVALGEHRKNNSGLRRVWQQACREENINPRKPTRLPLLFAIDKKLQITGGFRYAADCRALRPGETALPYCGGDFSGKDYSFENDSDFFGDRADGSADGDSGADSGCGGGCGGGD